MHGDLILDGAMALAALSFSFYMVAGGIALLRAKNSALDLVSHLIKNIDVKTEVKPNVV